MFIAHLPAGYLVTKRRAGADRAVLAAGMVGSVLPDVDMLWFYLVDARRHHHHAYWTHFPVVWLAAAALSAVALRGRARAIALALTLNALLHLVLDTVAGDVRWLAPWSAAAWSLFTVPATHGASWVLSFVLHWSFLLELAITAAALAYWARSTSTVTVPSSSREM